MHLNCTGMERYKIRSPEHVPEITQALFDQKYDETSIRGILGKN